MISYSINLKNIENSLRQTGIEAEDAFYTIAHLYIQNYNPPSSPRLENIAERGKKIVENSMLLNIFQLQSFIKSDPKGELLPVLYQFFLSKRFRDSTGKFFTPHSIASSMTSMLPVVEGAIIMDPTCGGGTFLIEASKRWKNLNCTLIGNDIDNSLLDLSELVLSLGSPLIHKKQLINSNIFQPIIEFESFYEKVDYILANPPFSLQINDISVPSKLFKLGYQNSDAIFLDIANKLLKPGGRLICLLPHSIISNKEFFNLRQSIEEDWNLLGVIILPEGVFHLTSNTTTRADILIIEKKGKVPPSKVLFCNAPSVGIPLNGHQLNIDDNALEEIISNDETLAILNLR